MPNDECGAISSQHSSKYFTGCGMITTENIKVNEAIDINSMYRSQSHYSSNLYSQTVDGASEYNSNLEPRQPHVSILSETKL